MNPDYRNIPLSLYVHLPWCVRKCPYCDFNSHRAPGQVPEQAYLRALLEDLEQDLALTGERRIETIFIGGGTPSLFSPESVAALLRGVRARVALAEDAEITLEANPGAADQARFAGFRQAGVNRLSIGVQSFDDRALKALGRIHDAAAARNAVLDARAAGFDNLNLDLMFALPGQCESEAVKDMADAVALAPEHISHYQLTLEPGTPFYHRPPELPDDDSAWRMQRACAKALRRAGYRQYEVSAWARPRRQCRHNLNYWRFGDYLGVGAGAHAKLTLADGGVLRYAKQRHPGHYQARVKGPGRLAESRRVGASERGFEFALNALRLNQGASAHSFRHRTGLPLSAFSRVISQARNRGLLLSRPDRLQASARGRRFLNDLTAMFLPA